MTSSSASGSPASPRSPTACNPSTRALAKGLEQRNDEDLDEIPENTNILVLKDKEDDMELINNHKSY